MKRDMDLIREILLEIERSPDPFYSKDIELENYSQDMINFHIMLLSQAGLINATNVSAHDDIQWIPNYITWGGYEFLNAARDDKRWNQAKEITSKLGGFVFDVVKAYLIELMLKGI